VWNEETERMVARATRRHEVTIMLLEMVGVALVAAFALIVFWPAVLLVGAAASLAAAWRMHRDGPRSL
jgi:hypothetical protein